MRYIVQDIGNVTHIHANTELDIHVRCAIGILCFCFFLVTSWYLTLGLLQNTDKLANITPISF